MSVNSRYFGLTTFILGTVFSRLSYGQVSDAPSDDGLLTVDYIIIGVTSGAAAFCLALVIYVVIKNRMKKKAETKVSNFPEDGDKHSMVSSKSSKSSKSSASKAADNHGFNRGEDDKLNSY